MYLSVQGCVCCPLSFRPSPPRLSASPRGPLISCLQTRMAAEGESQRDSDEAPSTAPPPAALRLSLSAEEKASLVAEIDRLQATSVMCKIAGFRPSRGEMRDLEFAAAHHAPPPSPCSLRAPPLLPFALALALALATSVPPPCPLSPSRSLPRCVCVCVWVCVCGCV